MDFGLAHLETQSKDEKGLQEVVATCMYLEYSSPPLERPP